MPRIMSKNVWKRCPCNGLVNKSETMIPSERQWIKLFSPQVIRPFIKKYLMFMYVECCPAEVCPFHSMLMALLLSCAKLLSSMLYACASMKCTVHRVCGATLVAQTSFASVQLFVLSFCLDDFALSAPFPIMVMQPVWLVMSPCKVYAASTHVFNILILCIDRVRGMLKVC